MLVPYVCCVFTLEYFERFTANILSMQDDNNTGMHARQDGLQVGREGSCRLCRRSRERLDSACTQQPYRSHLLLHSLS